MPPTPRAMAPPPTYTIGLELWPANIEPIPTIMASIGRYISVCWKLSGVTSGISGGDWSRISPLGSSGGSCRSVRRTMMVLTGRLSSGRSAHVRRAVPAVAQRDWTGWSALRRVIILRPYFRPSGRCAQRAHAAEHGRAAGGQPSLGCPLAPMTRIKTTLLNRVARYAHDGRRKRPVPDHRGRAVPARRHRAARLRVLRRPVPRRGQVRRPGRARRGRREGRMGAAAARPGAVLAGHDAAPGGSARWRNDLPAAAPGPVAADGL